MRKCVFCGVKLPEPRVFTTCVRCWGSDAEDNAARLTRRLRNRAARMFAREMNRGYYTTIGVVKRQVMEVFK